MEKSYLGAFDQPDEVREFPFVICQGGQPVQFTSQL